MSEKYMKPEKIGSIITEEKDRWIVELAYNNKGIGLYLDYNKSDNDREDAIKKSKEHINTFRDKVKKLKFVIPEHVNNE